MLLVVTRTKFSELQSSAMADHSESGAEQRCFLGCFKIGYDPNEEQLCGEEVK